MNSRSSLLKTGSFDLSARMEIETPKQPGTSLGRPILRSTMQASFGTNWIPPSTVLSPGWPSTLGFLQQIELADFIPTPTEYVSDVTFLFYSFSSEAGDFRCFWDLRRLCLAESYIGYSFCGRILCLQRILRSSIEVYSAIEYRNRYMNPEALLPHLILKALPPNKKSLLRQSYSSCSPSQVRRQSGHVWAGFSRSLLFFQSRLDCAILHSINIGFCILIPNCIKYRF